jgi:hypothetical protein
VWHFERGEGKPDTPRFKQYYELADMLIEKAAKEQPAECARLLVLNLAHHRPSIEAEYGSKRRVVPIGLVSEQRLRG